MQVEEDGGGDISSYEHGEGPSEDPSSPGNIGPQQIGEHQIQRFHAKKETVKDISYRVGGNLPSQSPSRGLIPGLYNEFEIPYSPRVHRAGHAGTHL